MITIVIDHDKVVVIGDHLNRHPFNQAAFLDYLPLYHPTPSSWKRLLRVMTKPIVCINGPYINIQQARKAHREVV